MAIAELLVKINGNTSGLNSSIDKADASLDKFLTKAEEVSKAFEQLGKKLTVSVTLPIIALGTAMAKEAADAEKATVLLGNAIKAVGNEGKVSVKNLKDYASELQNVSKYGDDLTVSAFTLLEQLTALDENGLKALMPSIQNMASALDMDLVQAANLVGKTIGTSTNALSRYGVEVDASASKSQKMAAVLAGLSKYNGAAAAEASTFAGRLAILKNQAGDLAESFGDQLLPILSKLVSEVGKVVAWFANLTVGQKKTILTIAALAASVGPIILGFTQVSKVVMGFAAAVKFLNVSALAGPLGLIALLAGAIVALVSFAQNAKNAQDRLKDLYENPSKYGLEELQKQLDVENKAIAGITKEREAQIVSLKRQGASEKEIAASIEATFGAELKAATAARDRLQVEVDKKKALEAAAKAQEAKDDAELKRLQDEMAALQAEQKAAEEAKKAWEEANITIEFGVEATHEYSENLQQMLDDVKPIVPSFEKFKNVMGKILGVAGQLVQPFVDLGEALGADAEEMAALGGIATDAINGIAAALSGNLIGVVIAAIGFVTKLINLFKKKKEAEREAKRSTESYMDTVTSGEGVLLKTIATLQKLGTSLAGIFSYSLDTASMEALRKLKAFKELAASYGDSIGQALGDAIIKGTDKVDFMAAIGKILIDAMIAAALATGPIASAMAAIGEKIAYMVVNGFTAEGIAEVEKMASDLYDIFSTGVLPIVDTIRGIFGGGGGSEEVGSFAGGVDNWHGGRARVGEQGPETVYLPKGSSVVPNGKDSGGGISMHFHSPKALSPLEMTLQMTAASRQLAFETGVNL